MLVTMEVDKTGEGPGRLWCRTGCKTISIAPAKEERRIRHERGTYRSLSEAEMSCLHAEPRVPYGCRAISVYRIIITNDTMRTRP